MEHIQIRVAAEQDAADLLRIYAPYVENTAITFEYAVPSLAEFTDRIRNTLKQYPYLVAQADGDILGYTYASPFGKRAAYGWGVETSIYVERSKRGMGVGRALYEALENTLAAQNILNLNACIAYPEEEGAHLTKDSVSFHQHMGYRLVGQFHQCGYKFHQWYHIVWMEKLIGEHRELQPAVKSFDEVRELIRREYGIR